VEPDIMQTSSLCYPGEVVVQYAVLNWLAFDTGKDKVVWLT
jgi:hypothetical protein